MTTEQLPAAQEQPSILNLIAETAKTGNVDTLEKLINLQNMQLDRQARRAYSRSFVAMKPKLPRVIKSHTNKFTNSMYAKLEDINNEIDPILSEHGFATAHKIISQKDNLITVRVEIWHEEGHVESTELTMPLDSAGKDGKSNKTQIQAISSTVTYLRRVGLCALLNISTGDDIDGNKVTSDDYMQENLPVITRAHREELLNLVMGATENARKWFYETYKTIDNVPDSHVIQRINQMKQRQAVQDATINQQETL